VKTIEVYLTRLKKNMRKNENQKMKLRF